MHADRPVPMQTRRREKEHSSDAGQAEEKAYNHHPKVRPEGHRVPGHTVRQKTAPGAIRVAGSNFPKFIQAGGQIRGVRDGMAPAAFRQQGKEIPLVGDRRANGQKADKVQNKGEICLQNFHQDYQRKSRESTQKLSSATT